MFFKNMESIIKGQASRNLKQLEYYYAIELELYRAVKDIHTDVYGVNAGEKVTKICDFRGILISDDFFPSSAAYAGNFEEGFLYTSSDAPKVADIIRVRSADGKQRRFKLATFETVGTQDSVFTRYKIINLAD